MEKRSKYFQCGVGDVDITGCRIGVYPMSDDYVPIILGAIDKTDTQRVWSQTDSMGTIFRGQQKDVIETSKALFCNAFRDKVHMTSSMTFSNGCPGDVEADYLKAIKTMEEYPRHPYSDKSCEAVISFYTFARNDYMERIHDVIELCDSLGVYENKSHYSTVLTGSIEEIFNAYDQILTYAHENLEHYVLETILSVNSPSKEGKF
ncbi:YkoF family thiamine/hydroxymethylpyrimidine-binding protein [Erysipelothrix urinaevulpis]|uniref:YkoF family thiamine/hydroxymethylpyrimidine-binding protein n=1 Tax=Erysipelothrix urinaevulpis TaxID=2683717 RepID=UPI001357999C|nr:YkoF family thiamine/hydroxymethylpyrimidine-binding protein [Erysipelothrix urinaevulpis]